MKYFDAHCHIQFSGYDEDRDEVLGRMQDAEVGGLIVGVNAITSEAAVTLVQDKADLFAAIGLHPNDVQAGFDDSLYERLVQDPKVRAIGECGLDYFRPEEPEEVKKLQKEIFEKHMELAVKYNKPLMVHSRPSKGSQDAYRDTIDMLRSKKQEYGDKLHGDMHFFVGGVEEARDFIDLGFTLSYTAVITFARDYDDVIRYVPLSALLSETDSPYVAPAPNRGKRNEPIAVRNVIQAIAEIRGEEEGMVRQAILQNARQKFSII